MVSTLEITVQQMPAGGDWPVVAEYHRAGQLLPVRTEGRLVLANEPVSALPQAYGKALGKALFTGAIRDAFVAARGEAQVRVWLCIEDPVLRTWRWEWLCAPLDGNRWDFLSLDQRALYSLYLPSLTDRPYPPIGRHDLRALALVANPADLDHRYGLAVYDSAAAIERLRATFDGHEPRVSCEVLASAPGAVGPPTLDALVMQLTAGMAEGPYSILHVVCHGRFDGDETWLFLEGASADESGLASVQPISATELIERLARVRQLPHLVFLSVCESSAPEAEQRLGGLAQRLVRELGIPAVIGMTELVTVATAQVLSDAFYKRLFNQKNTGAVDRALVEAYAGLAQKLDVHVPALYSRLGTHPLFSTAVDRSLSANEIRVGLDRLEALLIERGPVLLPEMIRHRQALNPWLGTDTKSLSPDAQQAREAALQSINEICQEAVDITFHALVNGDSVPLYDDRQPFRGLEHFRTEDQEFFFGRQNVIETLAEKLAEDPFLPVLGPSGSGKSSVVLAGLVPHLQRQDPKLQVAYLTPGNTPLERLHAVQTTLSEDPVLYVVDQFEEIFTNCHKLADRHAFINSLLELTKQNLVVLTMRADFWGDCAPYAALKARMQERQELIGPMTTTELRAAMEQQAAKVGLRFEADLGFTILEEVVDEPGAMPLLQHALLELWRRRHGRWLRTAEYRAIGGVKRAIAETAEKLYAELSESEKELMRDILLRLTKPDEHILLGEERRDTRRRVSFKDLIPVQSDPEVIKELVKRLADAVLLVTSHNPHTGEDEVEVAHEALIRYWDKLRNWLDEDREELRIWHNIGEAAKEWSKISTDESLLLHRGGRLDAALTLRNKGRFSFTDLEDRYINACDHLHKQLLNEKVARARNSVKARAAILMLLIIGGIAFVWAFREQERGALEARDSEARRLILQADSTRQNHKLRELSALLAIEALRLRPSIEADQALRRSLAVLPRNLLVESTSEPIDAIALSADGSTFSAVAGNLLKLWKDGRLLNELEGAGDGALAIDAAGHYLALYGNSAIAVIDILHWPARLDDCLILKMENKIRDVVFSPDGQLLASTDGITVKVWHANDGSMVGEIKLSEDAESIGISNDAVVLAAHKSSFERWHIQTKKQIYRYVRPASGNFNSTIIPSTFIASPDGRWVVWKEQLGLGHLPPSLFIMDAATGAELYELHDPGGFFRAKFSGDGRLLITSTINDGESLEATLKIWDVQTAAEQSRLWSVESENFPLVVGGQATTVLLGQTSEEIEFTNVQLPDGGQASMPWPKREYTIKLIDGFPRDSLLSPKIQVSLTPPYGLNAPALALNNDGGRLAVASMGEVSVWDVINESILTKFKYDDPQLIENKSIALSPNGEKVAIAADIATNPTEGLLKIVDVQSSKEEKSRQLSGVENIMYSPDGKFLAVNAGLSVEILNRDLSSYSSVPATIPSGYSIALHGTSIAGYDAKNGFTVWDAETKNQTILFAAHEDYRSHGDSAAFSANGRFLITGSKYEDTLVWEGKEFKSVTRIHDERVSDSDDSEINGLSITGDGRFVAKAIDESIAVWDAIDGTQIADITINDEGGKTHGDVVFSADGKVAAWYNLEKGIRVVPLLPEDLIKQGCKLLSRNMTDEEWARYMRKGKRQKACENLP